MYFDSTGIEYIPKEVLNNIKKKFFTHLMSRIQYVDTIMRGFYCIAFIELYYCRKILFSLNEYRKNDKIICKYFKVKYCKRKLKEKQKIEETRKCLLLNYLLKHNYLISKKHKKVCKVLNYLKHLLIFIYIVSRCVLISVFASLVNVPVGITNSAV